MVFGHDSSRIAAMPPLKPPAPRAYRSAHRDAAAAHTRDRVVAAARELLAAGDGLRGFSLEAVAQRAGVTRLTVYNQFGSRRALLEAMFDDLAQRGGLQDIAAAMAEADPRAALSQLVAVFCRFFASAHPLMQPLMAAAASDPELHESVRQRNERRRQLMKVLVSRMKARGEVRTEAARDLVDVLWALTSAPFFIELTAAGRSTKAACDLVQGLVDDAVRRASTKAGDRLA